MQVFRLWQQDSPLIVSVPHAGRFYEAPVGVQPQLGGDDLRAGEDPYVDGLGLAALRAGASLIVQRVPRAYLDLNRAPDEMSSAQIAAGRAIWRESFKARHGLGVVPTMLRPRKPLYADRLTEAEINRRVASYYWPYHEALQAQIQRALQDFGQAILLDLHSMPPLPPSGLFSASPHLVLSDCFGKSAGSRLSNLVIRTGKQSGFRVAHNKPFSGGEIIQRHGAPTRNIQALQLEICRGTYLKAPEFLRKAASYKAVQGFVYDLTCQLQEAATR